MANVCNMVIDVRPGEHVFLDGRKIVVELLKKSGNLARLKVSAPSDVKIEREVCVQPRPMRDKMEL